MIFAYGWQHIMYCRLLWVAALFSQGVWWSGRSEAKLVLLVLSGRLTKRGCCLTCKLAHVGCEHAALLVAVLARHMALYMMQCCMMLALGCSMPYSMPLSVCNHGPPRSISVLVLCRALSNVADEGLLTEGWFWIPSLAGPSSLASRASVSSHAGFPLPLLPPFGYI